MWREVRADRLEAAVLTDLFAAGDIADEAEGAGVVAAAVPGEPEPRTLNRHQRRALAVIERQAPRHAA